MPMTRLLVGPSPLLLVLALVPSSPRLEQDQAQNSERQKIFKEVQKRIQEQDVYAAIEYVYRLGDDKLVLTTFSNLVFDLHHLAKSTEHVLALGRAGIDYAILRSAQVKAKDAKRARQLRYTAKIMATNLASFTWPGWNEKGIRITQSQLLEGLEAAKLSVRIALELELDDAKLSFTYWFLGAQRLANQQYAEAIEIFTLAQEHALRQGKNEEGAAMNLGYIGLARILDGKTTAGEKTFAEALTKLDKIGNEDATFYAQQLREVRKFFEAR